MMKLLLDTHALLWSIMGKGLSEDAIRAFVAAENCLYLSAASYWEICIKFSIGKLDLETDWEKIMDREMAVNGIRWQPIEKEHLIFSEEKRLL
ncbi:MAG: type II toxin-antitoxin system VapC family toxin [Halieaceae bacterium]|nr:type II toxin-antitoxin system VapC family toxin [Halieaceae bacterium]